MRMRGGVRLLGRIVPAVQSAFRKRALGLRRRRCKVPRSYAQDHFPKSCLTRGVRQEALDKRQRVFERGVALGSYSTVAERDGCGNK